MDELVETYDFIVRRKGKGLMQGLEFTIPVGELNQQTLKEGLLVIQAQGNVIRFVPPLIMEEKHVDEMIIRLKRAFKNMNLIG